MRRPGGEQGSVLVLTLGLVAVLLVLVGVVVDVSAAALARRAVSSAADGAAVAAAQALSVEAYYQDGADEDIPLSDPLVEGRVQAYAAREQRNQPGLAMSSRVVGGGTVIVGASRTVGLPFGGWLGVSDVEVTAEASARSPVGAR